MKKSLFLSTLIAAVALVAPAFATGDGTLDSPYSGSISGLNPDNSEGTNGVVYIQNITGGYLVGTTDSVPLTITSNLDISYDPESTSESKNGITLTDANSGVVYTFTGTITGNGDWTFSGGTSATTTQHYVFTGDLSGYSGSFSMTAGGSSRSEGYLQFGNGGQAATNTAVSGTGSITTSTAGSGFAVIYNYGSLASGSETAITISNSSITTQDLQFTGSVSYNVSSALAGAGSSATLTISNTGTTTLNGEVSGFSTITINSGSTLAVGSTGSLDLSGTTVNIGSTIQNSGSIIMTDSTSLVVDTKVLTGSGEWSTGKSYTLVTGTGSIEDYDAANISTNVYGATSSVSYDNGTLTITFTDNADATGLHGSGESDHAYYTTGTSNTISISTSIFTGAGTTVYLASSTQSLGTAEENVYWSGSVTAACDIVIGAAGIHVTNTTSSNVHTFSGKISGSGDWTATGEGTTQAATASQHYIFTGDLSEWTGSFTITTVNTDDYVRYGNGSTAVTNTSVSGASGAIAVDYGTVQYNYSAGAGGATGETLTVTNSSIEAHTITFAGSVNYDVSSSLIGYDGDSTATTNSTLEISTAGTVTASGSISNFDIVTVSENSTLAIAETGSLDISGTTVTLASAIQNSGSITVSESTSFVIDGIEMGTKEGNDYYVLIAGGDGASITGSESLTSSNFSGGSVDSSWSVWTDGLSSGYVVIYGEATKDLTWDGTDGNTWNTSDTNWSGGSTFKSGDNVTFGGTSGGTITLGEAIEAGTITITDSGDYTISNGDGAGTSLKATSITVTAANGTTTTIDVSTLEVEETISIKPVSGDTTGAAHRVLVIGSETNATTATAGALFMQGSSELQISKGSTLTVSGNLTETGGFGETISGEGTLIIEGTATHSQGTAWVISIADFQAGAYAGGSGSATFSGASVTIGTMTTGSGAITFSGGASEVGTLTLSSSGASLTYSGEGTHTVGELIAYINSGATLDYSGLTGEGSLTIAKLDFGDTGPLTINGSANGTITEISFTKDGATLAISGVVNVGTVNITTSNDMGNITIAEGATLNVSGAINVSPGGFSSGNYSTITGASAEKSTVVTGSLNIGSGTTGAGLEVKNTTLITGGITFSDGISGSTTGGLFYLYLDDVTLGFTQDVTIVAGREGNSYIELGDKSSSSSTDTTDVASTTTINTSKYVVDSTTGTGEFTTEGVSVTIAESIIGTYATLAVEGAGSLTLSGTTTVSGLTLSSGSLDIAGTTSVTSGLTVSGGTLSVSEGGELTLAGEVTLASAISNSGTITIATGTSFVIDGMTSSTWEATGSEYYVLIDGSSSNSSSVTLNGNVTFTIDGTEITLNGLIQRYAEGDTWNVYTQDGYLVIYGTASTTAQTADDLYWAGTDGNNTWVTGESSVDWSNADDGSAGYYFDTGANVTFGENAANKTVVLGENITAGEVNINASGYTLTGSGYTLTATKIVLDDEDSDTEHKFTIDTGVKVTAESLEEKAGQLDLVVNGELEVTTMTVTTTQDESISGSGKLSVGTFEYSSDHGVSLTISVAEATFGSITEQASGTENSGDLRHLIFGDGTSTTTASVTSMEIKGLSEVQVAKDSTLTITELVDSSGWNTTISGDGSIKIGSMTASGSSTNGSSMLTISIANFESGAITFSGTNSLTISSASFKADSIVFTGGNEGNSSGAGGITISSGANAIVGLIQSDKTHTLTVEDGATLTAGEIYRSGNTLNLVVNGTLNVEKGLEGYADSTGMISFGKSEDGGTSMAQTISGTGTANVYGIEANLGGGSLTISVTNLNIGEGGITRYGSGNGTVNINGTKVGLYNTNASTISADMTVGASGVTFNMNSGETMTISGALSGSGTIEKTGVGTLVLSAENSLTGTVTISAGTVEVTNGSALGSGTVSVSSGAKLQLDTAVSTSGTVTFSGDAKLVIGGDLLKQLATSYNATESEAVAIITASDITFGETSLSTYESISDSDTFDSFINKYVSAGDYMLTWSWSYIDGTGILSASVTSIPEPGIFSTLFGLGAIGLVATRRRRRA